MAAEYEIKTAKNGKIHFNLKAGNGQIILSSEMYESKSAAENGIESCKKNSGDDGRYDRKESANGKFHFNLKAGNGQVIGSSEMYETKGAMENGIESVKKNGPDAKIDDQTT
jgi:uncharacterized protein YegP (UPF0339 family)